MIGIFIGISMVVSLVSLGQGMQSAVNSQFASVGVDKVIIRPTSPGFGPPGQDSSGNLTERSLKVISRVSGVKSAAGRFISSVKIEFNKLAKFGFLTTLPKDSVERNLLIEAQDIKVKEGRMLRSDDSGKILIGSNYAEKKIFEKNIVIGNKVFIEGSVFEVVGIIDKRGNPITDELIIMNEDVFRKIKNLNSYSVIFAQVEEGGDVNLVSERVARDLRRYKNQKEGFEDFEVQTSQEMIDSFNNILSIINIFVIGIAFISIIVGGIGIMNTMYTSVLERTKEIGVMKAIGAKNKDVLLLFLIESGVIGLVGGGIGLLLGVFFSLFVVFVAKTFLGAGIIGANFSFVLIFGTLFFSFFIGAVSGVFPALQASKMKPVDALRK
jgi:putative ABC transport system permease protein